MKKLNKEEILLKFFDISRPTFFKHKREYRPVTMCVLQYFSINEIEEFLTTQKIKKYDDLLQIQKIVIQKNCTKYINTFIQKTISNTIKFANPFFLDFYFTFLLHFNTFDQSQKFTTILNNFLIDYAQNKDILLLKSISPYMYLFNEFDELMIIFLSKNVDTNLTILIEEPDALSNQIRKEEIYFHIIALYIYRNHSQLKSGLKIELIQNLHDRVRDEFFTDELLIEFIIQNADEAIKFLSNDLNFDKDLY
jgi:hypothetical protein